MLNNMTNFLRFLFQTDELSATGAKHRPSATNVRTRRKKATRPRARIREPEPAIEPDKSRRQTRSTAIAKTKIPVTSLSQRREAKGRRRKT